MTHIMRIDEMKNPHGLSGWKIENSNTNFDDFNVPLLDMGIVAYIKLKYDDDVYGTHDNMQSFGGNWRVYTFENRRNRIDFFVNDGYFGLIPNKNSLHERSDVNDNAKDIVEMIIQDSVESRDYHDRNMSLQV